MIMRGRLDVAMVLGGLPGGRLDIGLSAAARTVWAKHDRKSEGWLPLWRHMADSGSVAGLLWDYWLPGQVRRLIGAALPGGIDDGRRLGMWLATAHDCGKASSAFACQVESLAACMREAGLDMSTYRQMPDRRIAPHGLAGQLLLQDWLVERHGWTQRAALQLGVVIGGHHGVPPSYLGLKQASDHRGLLHPAGAETQWHAVQTELLDACARACEVSDRLAAWRQVKLPQPVQVLLTGLVIVADWIASNPDLFPYFPQAERQSDAERIDAAWRGLDLPPPWLPVEPTDSAAELILSRFALPAGSQVRPVQQRAVELARAMTAPGLMIIEAPMGEGKTEAAWAVAEIFAARSGAGGCFVALPTMATVNAIFPRMLTWVERVPDGRAEPGERSVFLAHSKAGLNEEFTGLLRGAGRAVRGVDQDGDTDRWNPRDDKRTASAELVAHVWLQGRKKKMLASFGAGTIDQLLFMGLKSRHLALRHLALAGKIVVIDEAHAYDTYMSSYLDRVLSWLAAYRVPVVVLSATLPARRRRELVQAYSGAAAEAPDLVEVEQAAGYPLLTAVAPGAAAVTSTVEPSGRRVEVVVERLDDGLDVLGDRLVDELAEGGCALVVRNTVDRVVETARYLRERFGHGAVTVAHARFVDLDRADKDADLVRRFGPPDKSAGQRPTGPHIVVASQVAEQSLDIDFDLLVSDLCPVDLLLQRMGRLHRHLRGAGQGERPPRLRTARCLVTGTDWDTVPVAPVGGSVRVYRLHALLRAAAALEPYLAGTADTGHVVRLPEDISPLVQAAYRDAPVGPDGWQEAMAQAWLNQQVHDERQREKSLAFQLGDVGAPGRAVIGWVDAGAGDADDTRAGRAQVRDSVESLEVLVVQRRADGVLTTLPTLTEGRGGLELPTEAVPPARVARIVAACGLRLPRHFSDPKVLDQAIEELEAGGIAAWQSPDCHWLAGELVLVLDENGRTRLAGYDLRYSSTDGLEVIRAQ